MQNIRIFPFYSLDADAVVMSRMFPVTTDKTECSAAKYSVFICKSPRKRVKLYYLQFAKRHAQCLQINKKSLIQISKSKLSILANAKMILIF